MPEKPLVSICIPTYNAVKFIEETIDCFLDQTYHNWEIIIQDDCSNDGTWELLLEKYNSNFKINLFRNPINLGIGKNWNEAYNNSKGAFIVIFNADDLVKNTFLEKSISYLKIYENADMVINSYLKSDELKTEELLSIAKSYKGITQDLININRRNFYRIHWNYTLIKKTSLEKLKNEYGLFYPTQVCDAMLWYECYKQNLSAFYTGDIVGIYRIHENNNSKIPLGEFESTLLWMIPKYKDILKLKMKYKWSSRYILLFKYLYACLKYRKTAKLEAIRNIKNYV